MPGFAQCMRFLASQCEFNTNHACTQRVHPQESRPPRSITAQHDHAIAVAADCHSGTNRQKAVLRLTKPAQRSA